MHKSVYMYTYPFKHGSHTFSQSISMLSLIPW